MSAKIDELKINKAIELYNNGSSLRQCGEIVGVHEETLRRYFKKNNVNIRKCNTGRQPPNIITSLPEHEICTSYNNGVSENRLSKDYGISRGVVRRILKKHACKIRNQSESEKLKWESMSRDQRENQYSSAHKACIGRIRSQAELEKMALTRELNFPEWFIGIGEPELKQWLLDMGIEFKYQKACLSYNMDFLVDNIDLELTGHIGRNHPTNGFIYERSKRIYECGYKTLYVEFYGVDRLINNAGLILDIIRKINDGLYGEPHYLLLRIYEDRHELTEMA